MAGCQCVRCTPTSPAAAALHTTAALLRAGLLHAGLQATGASQKRQCAGRAFTRADTSGAARAQALGAAAESTSGLCSCRGSTDDMLAPRCAGCRRQGLNGALEEERWSLRHALMCRCYRWAGKPTSESRSAAAPARVLQAQARNARRPASLVPQPSSRLAGGRLCSRSKPSLSAQGGTSNITQCIPPR